MFMYIPQEGSDTSPLGGIVNSLGHIQYDLITQVLTYTYHLMVVYYAGIMAK